MYGIALEYRKSLTLLIISALVGSIWYAPLLSALIKPRVIDLSVASVAKQIERHEVASQASSIAYPQLGIQADIHLMPQTDPFTFADWGNISKNLRRGVAIAYPGEDIDEEEYLYIIGHSSDVYPHRYAFVFSGLAQASPGDTFSFTADQKQYDFTVTQKHVLRPTDLQRFVALTAAPVGKQRALVVTCWPLLTTKDRLVVVAERIR